MIKLLLISLYVVLCISGYGQNHYDYKKLIDSIRVSVNATHPYLEDNITEGEIIGGLNLMIDSTQNGLFLSSDRLDIYYMIHAESYDEFAIIIKHTHNHEYSFYAFESGEYSYEGKSSRDVIGNVIYSFRSTACYETPDVFMHITLREGKYVLKWISNKLSVGLHGTTLFRLLELLK